MSEAVAAQRSDPLTAEERAARIAAIRVAPTITAAVQALNVAGHPTTVGALTRWCHRNGYAPGTAVGRGWATPAERLEVAEDTIDEVRQALARGQGGVLAMAKAIGQAQAALGRHDSHMAALVGLRP